MKCSNVSVLVELNSDSKLEINQEALIPLSKIKSKKLSVVSIVGYESYQSISKIFGLTEARVFIDQNFSKLETSLLFSIIEYDEQTVLLLFHLEASCNLIRIISNLISSTILFYVDQASEFQETYACDCVSIVPYCCLEKETEIFLPENFSDFVQNIVFFIEIPRDPINLKSDYWKTQKINVFTSNSSQSDIIKSFQPKRYKAFNFEGDSLTAILISKH